MAYNVTFGTLKTSVLDQADEQGYGFVSTAELERLINRSYARLYARLAKASEDDYTASTTIGTVAGTEEYSLPADFLILRHLEVDLGGVKPVRLRKYMMREHHLLGSTWSPGQLIAYRAIGPDKIRFLPVPSGVHTVTVFYIPAPVVMDDDADVVDMRAGWDDWIVYDACMKIAMKQEADAATPKALRDDVWANEIAPLIASQDEADDEVVVDVDDDSYFDDGSW